MASASSVREVSAEIFLQEPLLEEVHEPWVLEIIQLWKDDDKPIALVHPKGFCLLSGGPPEEEGTWMVKVLYVFESYRRQGAATQLL
ncbi:MAG: GNAT family N-acetyltransferase, partial [Proteobacteria bacterium]|nr:GNAT family N-acetyltransferase [Pseudomonadota bacterium]